ncbi:enoyl-CoA hydratase-related protein [Mycobacterium sp. smrl_JER01]|uniref:enoyl-CoA hydratase-related protein n=1 Tax=Mycobacterium sp. smrl_JER01 TaxID=3402633 RepID=UPI003AC6358C
MTDLTVSVGDGVAVLTLNRPDRRNAYTEQMGELLSAAYRRCDDADDVRAIVLTGAGDAFCVGADLGSQTGPFGSTTDGFTASPIEPAAFELRTPVIAAVNGHAIGIGLTLALQADIRVMASDAKYAVAQARRGVIGDCMSHWTLPHLVGGAVAADLLLTGRTFDGVEAAAMRVATRSLPGAEVLDAAMAIARDIAVNVAPMSAALSKRLLWDTQIHGYPARHVAELETALHHRVMGSADAREGVSAFMHRRPPRWSASVSREWEPLPDR